MRADKLCVGLRVRVAQPEPSADRWRDAIGRVVAVYPGMLYCARVQFPDGREASFKASELEPALERGTAR